MDQWSTPDIEAVNAHLKEWSGAEALVVNFSISLCHLEISLWRPRCSTQLSILCYTPNFYCGPLRWSRAELEIVNCVVKGNSFEEFELRDNGANVSVKSGQVMITIRPARHWQKEADERTIQRDRRS
jgi:hypothetical protein